MKKRQRKDEPPPDPERRLAPWQFGCVKICALLPILPTLSPKFSAPWQVGAIAFTITLLGIAVYRAEYADPMTPDERWVAFFVLLLMPFAVFLFLFVVCMSRTKFM